MIRLQEVDVHQLTIAREWATQCWVLETAKHISCSTLATCSATAKLDLKLPARLLCLVNYICTSKDVCISSSRILLRAFCSRLAVSPKVW